MITFIIFYCMFTILMHAGATIAQLNDSNEDATASDFFGVFLGPLIIPMMLGAILYRILNDRIK